VLPVLHLNGFKIANPTMLARIPEADLVSLLRGYGYAPIIVNGDDPASVQSATRRRLDGAIVAIAEIHRVARGGTGVELPVRWPMVVLITAA
jgi:xylulose-5-phosphate/fructose-6-phosphate phosphoketolase